MSIFYRWANSEPNLTYKHPTIVNYDARNTLTGLLPHLRHYCQIVEHLLDCPLDSFFICCLSFLSTYNRKIRMSAWFELGSLELKAYLLTTRPPIYLHGQWVSKKRLGKTPIKGPGSARTISTLTMRVWILEQMSFKKLVPRRVAKIKHSDWLFHVKWLF